MMIRHTATAAMLAAIALTVAACGGEEDPEAAPSSSTAATPTTPPPSPTPTTPAWQAKYTAEEIQAYEAALQRFESYEQRSEGIWAAGKATPEAQRLFQAYNGNSSEYNRLVSFESGKIQVIGLGEILDSRPTKIQLTGTTSGTISIRQCVDYSDRKITQNGQTLPQITDKPQLRQINIYLGGEPPQWFIANIARGEGKSPC